MNSAAEYNDYEYMVLGITPDGIRTSLGTFSSEMRAAHVRNRYCAELGDEFVDLIVIPMIKSGLEYDIKFLLDSGIHMLDIMRFSSDSIGRLANLIRTRTASQFDTHEELTD